MQVEEIQVVTDFLRQQPGGLFDIIKYLTDEEVNHCFSDIPGEVRHKRTRIILDELRYRSSHTRPYTVDLSQGKASPEVIKLFLQLVHERISSR